MTDSSEESVTLIINWTHDWKLTYSWYVENRFVASVLLAENKNYLYVFLFFKIVTYTCNSPFLKCSFWKVFLNCRITLHKPYVVLHQNSAKVLNNNPWVKIRDFTVRVQFILTLLTWRHRLVDWYEFSVKKRTSIVVILVGCIQKYCHSNAGGNDSGKWFSLNYFRITPVTEEKVVFTPWSLLLASCVGRMMVTWIT